MPRTNRIVILVLPLIGLGVAASLAVVRAADATTKPAQGEKRTTASGLTIVDVGAQPMTAQKGDLVWVNYTGRLQSNGQKFDSSMDRRDPQTGMPDPIKFVLGQGHVIRGWDEGIAGMKVGDKRQLII